ncbi:MAG TPA: ABC transporter substrate-binding protein [Opitutaceae bacterium]|nr:ABC transporter substrate-binding protein [Opitutaceae bacterium]
MPASPAPPWSASVYREAPEFAQLVAAGKLPPVEQRLPRNPMLVEPEQQLGTYGGVWHLAMVGDERLFMRRVMAYENLVRWDRDWTRVIPNVAQSFEASADARTFTFKLREGMRWSDGQPFTSADIVFWYDAVYRHEEFAEEIPTSLRLGPEAFRIEAPDEYTVVFHFAEPEGLFLQRLATLHGAFPTGYPRHALARFHKDYNPDIERLVASEGATDWVDLFRRKTRVDWINNFLSTRPDIPALSAWIIEPGSFDADGRPAPVVRAVRNPYYWKIDTDYRQLPYIDRLEFKVVEKAADILPLVLAGEIDMQDRHIPPAAALPENQAKGGYGLYRLVSSFSNYMAISFNLTHEDPVRRRIFRSKDFRIGLSHAIDRPAIIRAAGLDVRPSQVAPLPGTPFYDSRMANQYLAYDVALANEHLDRAGLQPRDFEGFRLGPDGRRFRFTLLVPSPVAAGDFNVHLPMIQADWRAVGIDVAVEMIPRANAEKRWDGNDYDATAFTGAGGYDAVLAPRHYVPVEGFWSHQGIKWVRWYEAPECAGAEEPPEPVKTSVALYREILRTSDPERQNSLMREIIAIAADEFHVIGLHEVPVSYGILKPHFRNVPSLMFSAANYPQPGPSNPCQYFIEASPASSVRARATTP